MNTASPMPFPRSGVYAITDGPRDDLFAAAEAAIAGGIRVLQYRDGTSDAERRRSEADELGRMCARSGVTFLVCDDIALAGDVRAGVHLTGDHASVAEARAVLGADGIVGVSCFGSLDRARRYRDQGADYVSFGAMYASPTLPDAVPVPHDVLTHAGALDIPVVAIGGITADNAPRLLDAGADLVAAISSIFGARDIQSAARRLADLFDSAPGTAA